MAIKSLSIGGLINADPDTGIIVDGDECCGPACVCCVKDPWPILYATLDNFVQDTPWFAGGSGNFVPPGPDFFGDCSSMCENALNPGELNTMGLVAIPSNYNNGLSFPPGWEYNGVFGGNSSDLRIEVPDVEYLIFGGTAFADSCIDFVLSLVCERAAGVSQPYYYKIGSVFSPSINLIKRMFCGDRSESVPEPWIRCQWEVVDDLLHEPLLGLAGVSCDPFYLEAIVEYNVRGRPQSVLGTFCTTTGRFRLRITE